MFIIPMAGRSQRFLDAGYALPKHRLNLWGSTVFRHVIESFRNYFASDEFLFICRKDGNDAQFIREELADCAIERYEINVLPHDTCGQAETVYLGTRTIPASTEIFIFNIDTFRPGFQKPDFLPSCDGYLEVFRGEGERWSFVLPGDKGDVIQTAEKMRISDLCSNGLYYFGKKFLFDEAFAEQLSADRTVKGEHYISPLYNYLIKQGKRIRYKSVEGSKIINCGTPEEYEGLLTEGPLTMHWIQHQSHPNPA
jgi:NDP-sugar pyrophosphorylase family protein